MCAKEPKVPLKKSPSERNAEGKLHFTVHASHLKIPGSNTPKRRSLVCLALQARKMGGGASRVRVLRTCRVEHPQNIAKHKVQRAGVALRKQIRRTGMRRKSSHFGNQKFDYKGLCPIITYRQRFQTTHRSSPNVGEVTITYGASPIKSLHRYIGSFFLKHYAVHIFNDFADRAV